MRHPEHGPNLQPAGVVLAIMLVVAQRPAPPPVSEGERALLARIPARELAPLESVEQSETAVAAIDGARVLRGIMLPSGPQ